MEDFKVRQWKDLIHNSKRGSIYYGGGVGGEVSRLGGDKLQGVQEAMGMEWPGAAEMARNGSIRDTFWMTANKQAECR